MSNTDWCLDDDIQEDGFRHIYPAVDSLPHVLIGFTCPCSPTVDLENDLIIHNRGQ